MRSNLALRVLAAVVFGPVFLALFWTGGIPLLGGLWVVAGAGCREYYRMQEEKGLAPWRRFGVAASLVWCAWVYRFGDVRLILPMAALVLITLALALCRREGKLRVADAQATLAGVLYTGFLGGFALLVRTLPGAGGTANAWLAVLVLLGIWATDIAAYFSGLLLGRKHPVPHISPKKTEAGFAGGLVGALLVVGVGVWAAGVLSVRAGVGLGLVVGLGALLGDLVESALKRDAGVKDASNLIPGHGGVLDRFDSFLFVYPLVYLYVILLRALGG